MLIHGVRSPVCCGVLGQHMGGPCQDLLLGKVVSVGLSEQDQSLVNSCSVPCTECSLHGAGV